MAALQDMLSTHIWLLSWLVAIPAIEREAMSCRVGILQEGG